MTAQIADLYRWPAAGRDETFDSSIAWFDRSYYTARA